MKLIKKFLPIVIAVIAGALFAQSEMGKNLISKVKSLIGLGGSK